MNFNERLQRKEAVFGTMIRDAITPNVVDALLWAGLDFFVLDMEHTPLDLVLVGPLLQYAQARALPALVRVPTLDKAFIGRVLDCGATGVWLPHLDTVADAEKLAFLGRYPPQGGRGATIPWAKRQRAQTFSKQAEFFAHENSQVVLVGQIESKQAVEHIEEIMASGLLDAVVVGPLDLSLDLGVPGELRHPLVEEAIGQVLRAGLKHKVSVGLHTASLEDLRRWHSQGMNFLVYSYDLLLLAEKAGAARHEVLG